MGFKPFSDICAISFLLQREAKTGGEQCENRYYIQNAHIHPLLDRTRVDDRMQTLWAKTVFVMSAKKSVESHDLVLVGVVALQGTLTRAVVMRRWFLQPAHKAGNLMQRGVQVMILYVMHTL